jgi:trehalose/maltose hydrolase-like predicted phosphorylase
VSITIKENPIVKHLLIVSFLGNSWDAEVWMAPGLVVAYPQAAKQIAQYRVEKFPQAQANIKSAYQSSQNDTYFSPNGAVFPWVSGRYGNCTA